jgi:hypothetical protein
MYFYTKFHMRKLKHFRNRAYNNGYRSSERKRRSFVTPRSDWAQPARRPVFLNQLVDR